MDYKQQLDELLLTTARQNASDLHIAVGKKPTLRIDGALMPLEKSPVVTPEVADGLVSAMIDPSRKKNFMLRKELDFS